MNHDATKSDLSISLLPDGSGKVGIGTTSPHSLMHINGAINQAYNSDFGAISITPSSDVNMSLSLGYDASLGANGSGWIQSIKSATAYTPLLLNPNNGNVGIGTTSPGSTLQINGVTSMRTNTTTDGYISINPGSSTYQGYINWWKPGGTRVGYMGYTDGSTVNNLALTLEASANFIVNGGNVLIGKTSENPGVLQIGHWRQCQGR